MIQREKKQTFMCSTKYQKYIHKDFLKKECLSKERRWKTNLNHLLQFKMCPEKVYKNHSLEFLFFF